VRSRDDIELDKILNNPAKAREFIDTIEWGPEGKPENVVFGVDDVVFLNNMTDKDAVRAAHFILNTIEIPKIQLSFEFQFPDAIN
jgi:hypothetical protein